MGVLHSFLLLVEKKRRPTNQPTNANRERKKELCEFVGFLFLSFRRATVIIGNFGLARQQRLLIEKYIFLQANGKKVKAHISAWRRSDFKIPGMRTHESDKYRSPRIQPQCLLFH
jgi:hypothetical protein